MIFKKSKFLQFEFEKDFHMIEKPFFRKSIFWGTSHKQTLLVPTKWYKNLFTNDKYPLQLTRTRFCSLRNYFRALNTIPQYSFYCKKEINFYFQLFIAPFFMIILQTLVFEVWNKIA